jgi:transposase
MATTKEIDMELYAGIDLHSNNSVVSVLDQNDRVVYAKRLPNDLAAIIAALRSCSGKVHGVAVESTYNWYWLVDGLQDAGFALHLVNTAAVKQYDGLKYGGDFSDARHLAHLLRLGILPTGYIYPREERAVRDAMALLDEQKLAMKANLAVMRCLDVQVKALERSILAKAKLRQDYQTLKTVSGIGDVLALTIALETGDVGRFDSAGNFASYARTVSSRRESNGKKKGEGNAKCGNKHLAWAFIEAAHFAVRYDAAIKRWYQKKCASSLAVVAIKAVAHKLARACYHVMKEGKPFDVARAFG